MRFFKRIFIVIIALAIFVGIPWFFDATWMLWGSWFPALFGMMYLDDDEYQ